MIKMDFKIMKHKFIDEKSSNQPRIFSQITTIVSNPS